MSELERSPQVNELVSQAGKLRSKGLMHLKWACPLLSAAVSGPHGCDAMLLDRGFPRKSISSEYSPCARLPAKHLREFSDSILMQLCGVGIIIFLTVETR